MNTLVLLIVVGFAFYFLTKGYKPSDYNNINLHVKKRFSGDLKNHEAGLLIALMAKVAKADGRVSELEAELLSNTFTDISKVFENADEIRGELKNIYKNEKEGFENTLEIADKYYKLTKNDPFKRLKVMEYLLNLAFIDGEFSQTEFMITEDIANALQIKKQDFESLIAQFKAYYANKANESRLSLEKAYEVLGVEQGSDFETVKKSYRKLVRENHPDILMGQGKDQSIIDAATAKLQTINEAYELIKKSRGN